VSARFWPVAEPAQATYETLRAAALTAAPVGDELAAARLARRGLAGLIAWPHAEPVYLGQVVGAGRPAWCGDQDPRDVALAETYGFLVARAPVSSERTRTVTG
jgi:hypothetical protein